MKSLLMTALFLCLISGANANPYNKDDRYFRSASLATDVTKVIKKRGKVHKDRHGYTKKPAHKRTIVPGYQAERPAGERFLTDAAQAASEPFRAMGRALMQPSLAGVVAPLAAKATEIQNACGSRVISAIRHTKIAGTGGRLSLHASGRAVDMKGNPSCIYSKLHGWPGGYSIDYRRVNHVHISYAPGGPEWGIRFNHYSKRKRRRE